MVIFKNDVGEKCFEVLASIYPDAVYGVNKGGFSIKLLDDDPNLFILLNILQKHDVSPYISFHSNEKRTYTLHITRIYEKSDIQAAEMFYFTPSIYFGYDCYLNDNGIWELDTKKVSINEPFAKAHGGAIFLVENELKLAMESAGLLHMEFQPVELVGRKKKGLENKLFWRLYSDFTLPKLSPSFLMLDREGNPMPPGSTDGYPREGITFPEILIYPEYMYRESDLNAAGPFDLGRMNEELGADSDDMHVLIASRHFYEFCEERKLKIDWTPVRIEHGV